MDSALLHDYCAHVVRLDEIREFHGLLQRKERVVECNSEMGELTWIKWGPMKVSEARVTDKFAKYAMLSII